MTVWLVLIAAGLITFGIRFALIFLFGRVAIPPLVQRALRYVPPAVLSAMIVPELLLRDGVAAVTPDNPRLLAGLVAIAVAATSKNTLLTILAGMATLALIIQL